MVLNPLELLSDQSVLRALMQVVPGFYILAALYLAAIKRKSNEEDGPLELTEYRYSRTVYAILFGTFGGSAYMILNEHTYEWYPILLGEDEWLFVALLALLAIGVTIFYVIVVTQRLQWPWERAREMAHKACEKYGLFDACRRFGR